jgi:hypothetical protein
MVICGYLINGYLWLFIHGYLWLFYEWLFVVILLMAIRGSSIMVIGFYSINDY